ncbi:hypothetical protein AX14_013109 [Amanita brunnescens Koide BX004]|nr:hypothetical protein AX14_013109 [Amanita brunnescens Koide BX004]
MILLKKLMPPVRVRLFKRSSLAAAASPAGPQSIPDDWIRHAMASNARLAATAGVHPPSSSIGDIASTFTQMLIHLLDMNENRDDFYQIMKDIGSLIESTVRHAREYDAMSQEFVKVCNDFLTTISPMESWMARTLRDSVSPIRRAKTKPYDDILHNYQLQIQLLRGRLHILMLLPSSSTGVLPNAGVVTINDSTFIDVVGDQSIIQNHGTINVQTLHPDQMRTPQMDDLDLSDYREFKYGDLHSISIPWKRWQDMQEFTVSINNEIMTARTYTGEDALESFKNDVRIILAQKFRNTNFLQLFGVCPSKTVPTLIFHRDLKPVADFMHPEPRENLRLKFRVCRQWLDACHYLVQDCQFHAARRYLVKTQGQSDDALERNSWIIPFDVNADDACWHLYLDNFEHLQLSIVRLFFNYVGSM